MRQHTKLVRFLIPIAIFALLLGSCGGETPSPAAPVAEEPAPAVEVEEPAPVAEEEEPMAEEPTPVAEEEEPMAEEPTPVAEEEGPDAEPTPVAEEEEEEEPAAEAEEAAINDISYTVTDYEFNGPDSVPSGWTRIELVNEGDNIYHAQWMRLLDDRTMDDLMAVMAEDPEHAPEWLVNAGGPSAVMPGESTSAIVNLQPGLHIMTTFIPDAEGVPGIERGMVFPVNVTEAEGPLAQEPDADFTIGMADFTFDIPDTVEAGTYTFQAVNEGTHPHEAVLVRLAPDTSVGDFLAAMSPDAEPGPPPGSFAGGLQVIEPGESGYFEVGLEPGVYGLICLHPEPESGLPHFALGMVTEFTVE